MKKSLRHMTGVRKTVKEQLNYTLSQPLPHFATVSYAFRKRFTAEVIEDVF